MTSAARCPAGGAGSRGAHLAMRTRMPHDIFPAARWEAQLDALAARYRSAAPYPHIVLDDFLDRDGVARALAQFPAPESTTWKKYRHVNAQKLGKTERKTFPDAIGTVVDAMNAPRFLDFLSRLTGVEALLADATLEGG